VAAILIISVLLIFVASLAILRTKRPSSQEDAEQLPPGVSRRGLFGDAPGGYAFEVVGDDNAPPADEARQKQLETLRARAAGGDFEALKDARALGDTTSYRFILDALVGRCAENAADLRALAAYIARSDDLRSTPALAEMLLNEWRRNPTLASTAELLRVSALSDDAGTFERALSEALQIWEDGRLGGVRAGQLRALFEGEYWLLSSEAKRSGGGFVLKQKLADARRRLAAGTRGENPPTDAGFQDEIHARKKERP
jgi:hypothetical protein